jgi:hypothetical protein
LGLCDFSNAGEVNVSAALTIMGKKTRTPLGRETCGVDLLGHTQSCKGIVCGRQQRLADVESRENLTLKENDRMTALPQ